MNELDRRASDAGQQVTTTAGHLRKIAEELRSDELSRPAAQLADRGAQTLDDVGRYLAQSNGDRLLADAEDFARRRPWVLATAGVALGLAGSRMLKASAARRYRDDEYEPEAYGAASTPGAYGAASAPGAYGAGATPVSSDAAPFTAASQGSYGGGIYGTGSASPVSKSTEAERLTHSDGT